MSTSAARGPLVRAALATVATTAVVLSLAASDVPAQADSAVAPKSGAVTVTGAGWGHGKGMSQWGAYGAASKGLKYAEIVDFYYPGTDLDDLTGGNLIRVLISADNDNILHFRPASGLTVTDSAGVTYKLPTGSKYTKWRVSRSGSKRVLAYRSKSGKYVKVSTRLDPKKVWYVENGTSGTVKLALPGTSDRTYRGRLAARFSGKSLKTVNYLSIEAYLRSVVPSEMPGSWPAEALKAQSVAARTYAAKLRATTSSTIYDLCDTSACQVYKGTSTEYSATDKAVSATAGKVVEYKGKLALTMFSASNGGWSASGGSDYPYLKAKQDPYDGVKRDQSWSVTLSSSKVQKAYPSVGTLKSVQVTERDGDGTYGGRVDKVKITGSKGSVSVSGGSFKSTFGLKERLFKITGGSTSSNLTTTPETPAPSATATASATPTATASATATATPTPSATATATAKPTATATSPALTGAVLAAYKALSSADRTTLGAAKTGVITTSTGAYADFAVGRITCPTGKTCIVSFG
nr:SpoIID/LytB domain-containing protein [Propionicimonas sp.]